MTVLSEFDAAHEGAIVDTQLDDLCFRLATASTDGLVKLWDIHTPEDPKFLCDLEHKGVHQVAWAPVGTGATILLTAGADGWVRLWGPCDKRWEVVYEEDLSSHGEVRAVSWAPASIGAAFACALSDGTITATIHQGTVRSGETDVDHRWQRHSYALHKGQVHAVCWASSAGPENRGSLAGACLASAGDDGLRVWQILEVQGRVTEEELDAAAKAPMCDVAWKPWDGSYDTIASAKGRKVMFWCRDSVKWVVDQEVDFDEEVWKLEWYQAGSQLLVTCGTKDTDSGVEVEPKPESKQESKPRRLLKESRPAAPGTVPRWIRVVYQPRVAVRKAPALTAPSVTFLDAGEIVEIAEVRGGWIRIADAEKDARDVSEDCEAWVLQDGKAVSLGILLEDCIPRWFEVVFEPQIPVRKKASVQAPAIAFLQAGEVIQAEEIWQGWVRLSEEDRARLDISEDCGSWVLIDGHAKGAGRLLAACLPPSDQRTIDAEA
ncbi:unnamed protein product [Effrenium voratum]|nr:unnamed protein product [Effrenium voratum]